MTGIRHLGEYDAAGNLTEKGNIGISDINGDQVTFRTPGANDEYWHYTYDLLNRLTKVEKNGTLIAEYGYDPEGLRVFKKAHGETTHYIFEGTEPIFEKNVMTEKVHSYVYALGKHLARVDGEMDTYDNLRNNGVPVYFYTTDHLGSIKVVTDRDGATVFQADHTAFGERYGESKSDPNFDEWHSFTGKELDPDTELLYCNARWYDADTGRFISEDPADDPNNPNLYSYCRNNPLTITDPTGLISQEDAMKLHELFTTTEDHIAPPQYVQNVINSNVEAHGFNNAVQYGMGLLYIQTNLYKEAMKDPTKSYSLFTGNQKIPEIIQLEKETGIKYETWVLSFCELGFKSWIRDSNLALDSFHHSAVSVNLGLESIMFAFSLGLISKPQGLPNNPEVELGQFNLGKTEVYYRTMSRADYEILIKTGKIPATSETCISPTLEYSAQYDGVLVKFNVKSGTTDALESIGVRDNSMITMKKYGDMPTVYKGWVNENAFFKGEGLGGSKATGNAQINIGLGKGKALNTFNNNILSFEVVPK